MEGGTPPGERKRRSRILGQHIIKHRFQFRYAIRIAIFLAVVTFLIWLLGTLAVDRLVSARIVTDQEAIRYLKVITYIIGEVGIVALAVVFGLSLISSHPVAGPIYRFEKTLEQMRDGNLTLSVRLRPRDEFKEVADLFNQTLASLRAKIQNERDGVQAGLERAAKLAESLRQAG